MPWHRRKSNGQMRTLEGRKAIDHEDFAIKVIGRQWVDDIEKTKDVDGWLRKVRPKLQPTTRRKVYRKIPGR